MDIKACHGEMAKSLGRHLIGGCHPEEAALDIVELIVANLDTPTETQVRAVGVFVRSNLTRLDRDMSAFWSVMEDMTVALDATALPAPAFMKTIVVTR